MNELILKATTSGVALSFIAYMAGITIKKKCPFDIVNPLLISIILVIVFLKLFNIDYESYNASAKYLSYLLTPATVSLAVPLYQQLELLKKNIFAVVTAIACGVLTSLVSIFLLSRLFLLSHGDYVTLLPKSITTAIGMGLSEEYGGTVSITVAAIIVTGICGNLVAQTVCRLFKIKNALSQGLAIGTASHAIGTAKAMELGQIQGAASSLAIVVAGLLTVIGMAGFSSLI